MRLPNTMRAISRRPSIKQKCVHYRIDLEWIGDKSAPSFWKNGKLSMRLGFTPRRDKTNDEYATESVRRTWSVDEANVIAIVETDAMGESVAIAVIE